MSHSEEHESFQAEAVRAEDIRVGTSRAIDSLQFKPTADATRAEIVDTIIPRLKEKGYTFTVSDSHWVTAYDKSGQRVELSAIASEELLLDRRLCDEESITCAVREGRLGVQSKDDLKNIKDKVAYVSKFGESAFAALPLHRTPVTNNDPETMSGRDWMNLTTGQKSALIDKYKLSPEYVGQIVRRK